MAGGPFDDVIPKTQQEVGMKMRTAARAAGPAIHEGFETVMDIFYADSPDRWYAPTGALKNAEEGVGGGKVFFKKMKKLEWMIGLYIDDSKVSGHAGTTHSKKNPGYADDAYVTTKAFDEGIHGFDHTITNYYLPAINWTIPPITSPPPATAMEEFVDEAESIIDGIMGG